MKNKDGYSVDDDGDDDDDSEQKNWTRFWRK